MPTILTKVELVELLIRSMNCCHDMRELTGNQLFETKAIEFLYAIDDILRYDIETYKVL